MCIQVRSVMRCPNIVNGRRCGRISAGTLEENIDLPERCMWWGIYTAFDQPLRRPCFRCPRYYIHYVERAGNTKCARCYQALRVGMTRKTCNDEERKPGGREGPEQGAIVGERVVGASTASTAVNAA